MTVPRLLFALAALFAISVHAVTAQDAGAGSAKSSDIAGTYALISIDGRELPSTLHDGGPVIRSGSFTIGGDGTCTSRLVFSLPDGTDSSREVHATYTREGRKLTMKWKGAGTTIGSVEGDAFTMNNEGIVLAYRRQHSGEDGSRPSSPYNRPR